MTGPARKTGPARMTAPVTPLCEGETVCTVWRPRISLFLQRSVLLSFATALALASLGYLSLVQWLVAVPAFTLIFMLIFDDFAIWARHRGDAWFLTDQRLIFERAGEPEENAAVPLSGIEWARPWFWWALRLGFESGTSTVMRFVPRPREIRARILAAQAAAHRLEDGTPEDGTPDNRTPDGGTPDA